MMKGSPIFLSLILLSIFLYLNLFDSLPDEPHDSMRLELIHRHAPRLNARPKTKLESMIELLHNDIVRRKMISHKVGLSQRPGRKAWEMSTSNNDAIMPMYSGRSYYVPGQYFALFKVGTPFQKFKVIVDTGSTLTWLNCNQTYQYHRRVFYGNLSSSFKPIPCNSSTCEVDLAQELRASSTCPTPLTPCAYGDYSYEDGSTAKGFFFNETVTLSLTDGRKEKLDNVILGCNLEDKNFKKTDGLMGLGYSKNAFTLKVTRRFGGKFTYCLVDHWNPKNVSNYLIFGGNKNNQSLLSNMSYTKLELGLMEPYYVVNVVGMSIGGVMLKIPREAWDVDLNHGTILDSGTTATNLVSPAYELVTSTLMKSLSNFTRVTLKNKDLEFCFNSTGFNESLVPRLAFHFADGARFEPHVKGYIVDFEEFGEGVKCLGFQKYDMNIIGNLVQQNYLWEFDLLRHKVGFAASTCA